MSDDFFGQYFWTGSEVITHEGRLYAEEECIPYLAMPCIDTTVSGDNPLDIQGRYGQFRLHSSGTDYVWEHIPKDRLPKGFKLWMLVMGVS